jgi:anhydro-N-acetylmuramic acid kinase
MQAYHLIGVMSGTSLDGIDLCFVEFKKGNTFEFELIHTRTVDYSEKIKSKLITVERGSALDLVKADAELGTIIGGSINKFIKDYKITKVDAIASHGHTVFHDPSNGFSTQIGSPSQIYTITGIKTIADFRSVDVALKGQGAPLVPIGDQLLFGDFDSCLNLGGIANLSHQHEGKRIGFDVVVCNMALNHLAGKEGKTFDENGQMASEGQPKESLLRELNELEYFTLPFPKSLGKELFLEWYVPLLNKFDVTTADLMATMIEHMTCQLGRVIPVGTCLITGGGAYNQALVKALRKHVAASIHIPENQLIEFKEALLFAFLGFLRLTDQVNTLSSVTGAKQDSMGGCIYG